jgi:hypothetical protein
MKNLFAKVFAVIAMAIALNACATSPQPSTATVKEIYEVHEDGRIHVFYDRKMYKDFLSLGETPYRLIKIGKGPNRETMVFGLAKKDKKKRSGIPAIDLYEGKATADKNFYAEVRKHGRIYVFSEFKDVQPVRQFGHPNYFYMEIGAGPEKETVFYVLNKKTKKKKPLALIKTFKEKNNL